MDDVNGFLDSRLKTLPLSFDDGLNLNVVHGLFNFMIDIKSDCGCVGDDSEEQKYCDLKKSIRHNKLY